MITQDLVSYIKNELASGRDKESISVALKSRGWAQEDIENGFAQAQSASPVVPTITEIPTASRIFKESWEIYKKNLKALLIVGVIPALLSLAQSISKLYSNFSIDHSQEVGTGSIILIIVAVVFILFLIVLNVWAQVAQLIVIKEQDKVIGWEEAFQKAKKYGASYVWTGILSGLAVFGGFLLLIVPGILFSFWFSQVPFVVVEEDLSGIKALSRSKYYVKGRIGQVFGKLFYMGLVSLGLYILLFIVIGVMGAFGLPAEIAAVLGATFSLFWSPVALVFTYQVYRYLKLTRPATNS